MLTIDHVIIAVNDLSAASDSFRAAGFTVLPGGVHASGATHNALIVFADGMYLELMAPTGQDARPGTADYSFLFAHGEGFAGLCLSSDNLPAEVAAIRGRGGTVDDPAEGGRLRPDGVEMRWRGAWIDGQPLPFLIEDVTARTLRVTDDLASTTHANGATGISGVTVQAASDSVAARFAAVFGAEAQPYPCGGASIQLERAGTRDALTQVQLSGLRADVSAHGATLRRG